MIKKLLYIMMIMKLYLNLNMKYIRTIMFVSKEIKKIKNFYLQQ